MEKIYEINFFNVGIQGEESKKFDYYDLIKPGVSVLFGEKKNYIIYYKINEKTIQSSRIEEISIELDWITKITNFFVTEYNLQDITLLEGLLKCSYEEDDDGLYDYCKDKGGRVFFKNPNESIDIDISIFVVKQSVKGNFHLYKSNLFYENNSLNLKELNSGYFDLNSEQVVCWRKKWMNFKKQFFK